LHLKAIVQDLSALYVNTSLSDIEAVDSSLEKINQLSGLYEFRSTNLQSIKDRLMPFASPLISAKVFR
jgi:hypothetical protein